MKLRNPSPQHNRAETGTVLIVTLVLLLVVSLLGISAIELTSNDLKLSFDSAQKSISFQDAENARIEATKVADAMALALGSTPTSFAAASGKGRYNVGGPAPTVAEPAVRTIAFWNNDDNYRLTADGTSAYAIEYLGRRDMTPDADRATGATVSVHVFRITLHNTLGTGVQTTLQSTYVTNCGGTC